MRRVLFAALLLAGCAESKVDGEDASTDAALAVDASVIDAPPTADAGLSCWPRPVGHDCFPAGSVPDGGCLLTFSCLGTLRADAGSIGRACYTGPGCTTDTDCDCLEQRCLSGICWY